MPGSPWILTARTGLVQRVEHYLRRAANRPELRFPEPETGS